LLAVASDKTADTSVQIGRAVQARKPAPSIGSESGFNRNPCELHWTHSYTIDPDGRVYKCVYKCPRVAGRPEMAVADVLSRGADKAAPLTAARPWEQHCGDCAFLPVCLGGCLGGRYLRTGRVDQVHCRKPEFEAGYRETVLARYHSELGAREWEEVGRA
jgi:uncharacterized protein